MHWIMFGLAIIFEVCGTTCLKLSEGYTKIIPSILIFVFYGMAFAAGAVAVNKMDLSFFYAVWAALGIVIISIIGMTYFKEPVTIVKIISIGLIVAGVSGLQFSGASH